MLWLLAVTLIISWESEGCPAGYLLRQGAGAGAEAGVKVLPAGCSVTIEVPPNLYYVFSLQAQDPETGELGEESNRCSVVVDPTLVNSPVINCIDEPPSSVPAPFNLEIP